MPDSAPLLETAVGDGLAAALDLHASAVAASAGVDTYGDSVILRLVPNGWHTELLDLEKFDPTPRRAKANVTLADADSFIRYAMRHLTSATVVYADPGRHDFIAVLDDHDQRSQPRWREHRASLHVRRSVEWSRWLGISGKQMSQTEFGEFVEDNAYDVAEPAAADLIEMATHLQATSSVAFRSSARLDNGQRQFVYDETIDAKVGAAGTLTVPEQITLLLPVFECTEHRRVTARFRWRLKGSTLTVGIVIPGAERIERDAFDAVYRQVDGVLNCPVLLGTP